MQPTPPPRPTTKRSASDDSSTSTSPGWRSCTTVDCTSTPGDPNLADQPVDQLLGVTVGRLAQHLLGVQHACKVPRRRSPAVPTGNVGAACWDGKYSGAAHRLNAWG
jgi:hypothetical protein